MYNNYRWLYKWLFFTPLFYHQIISSSKYSSSDSVLPSVFLPKCTVSLALPSLPSLQFHSISFPLFLQTPLPSHFLELQSTSSSSLWENQCHYFFFPRKRELGTEKFTGHLLCWAYAVLRWFPFFWWFCLNQFHQLNRLTWWNLEKMLVKKILVCLQTKIM